MTEFETPATLEADAAGSSTAPTEAPAKAPEITPAMQVAAQGAVDAAFARINAQPKVRIRVPKVYGPQVVIINGARWNVPSNVFVEVPEQVAEQLALSGRI